MISNLDEVLLILRKWESTSARVVALLGRPAIAVKLEGKVFNAAKDGFGLVAGESFMVVDLSGCSLCTYEESVPLSQELKSVMPHDWDSSLHFSFPDGQGLSLFGVPA